MVARALPIQFLTNKDCIVIAEVTKGISTDIRHRNAGGISPKNTVKLWIKIEEIISTRIASRNDDSIKIPSQGGVIEVNGSVTNSLSFRGFSPDELDGGNIPLEPPTGELLSHEEITNFFVGKRFIFGIEILRYNNPKGQNYANVWPVTKIGIINDLLKKLPEFSPVA